MRYSARILAALLSVSLAANPASAALRIRTIPKAPVAPVNGALGAQTHTLNLSLPVSTLNSLPNLSLPSAALSPTQASATPDAAVQAAIPGATQAQAAASAVTPAQQVAPISAKKPFANKVAAIAQAVGRAAKPINTPGSTAGKAAADKVFAAISGEDVPDAGDSDFKRLLDENLEKWERGELAADGSHPGAEEILADAPRITERQLLKVARVNAGVEEAVTAAMEDILPGQVSVLSRGSSARQTQTDGNPDYDVMVTMPEEWRVPEFERFMSQHLGQLREVLAARIQPEAARLFSDRKARVKVGSYVELSDPITRRVDSGVYLLPVKVYGSGGRLLIDIDVAFSNRDKYTNDYPAYFQAQIEQVEKLGGAEAKEDVLSSIRLAKKLFQDVVGAYKVWRSGPSGVGVEQLVMQSGKVSDADRGRTIEEVGSFDAFIDRLYDAAFDEHGRMRAPKEARRLWVVHNPFREPANFLSHLGNRSFTRLANVARAYRQARSSGRPVSFGELRNARNMGAPSAPSASKAKAKALETRKISTVAIDIDSKFKPRRLHRILRRVRETIGHSVLAFRLERSGRGRANRFRVVAVVEGEVDSQKLGEEIVGKLRAPQITAAIAPGQPKEAQRLQLFVKAHGKPHTRQGQEVMRKLFKRFSRRMRHVGRVRMATRGAGTREFLVSIALTEEGGAAEAVKIAQEFFAARGVGAQLAGVAYPQEKAKDQGAAQAEAGTAPGALTLEMLEKFTLTGPKPAERGDAFMYAQGAKVMSPEHEMATASRMEPKASKNRETQRVVLQRRGTRTFVLIPRMNGQGEWRDRPMTVPYSMVQGIVTDTLVEVQFTGEEISSVKSIGSYPGDVIIGRAVGSGSKLRLEALFTEEGKPKSLYGRLALAGEDIKEGDIVQAFVGPGKSGYAAEALMNLGADLTPEIAAREIALRHGARGYFDSDVIEQAEEVGRTQDVGKEFAAIVAHMQEHAPNMKFEDMTDEPLVTVDPIGAGDLDDAFSVVKHEDGSYTWYLATADVAQYVPPGTPAFRAAARIGNTFYSVDKNGVPEYPMNHPVVSKNVSSLLAGKDSLAMMTRMRFSAKGEFLEDESEVFLAKVRVQGRYTYEQVTELWKNQKGHGIKHVDQITLARELSGKLNRGDLERGKLALQFEQVAHHEVEGEWRTEVVEEDPLLEESHKLIEELKVYGNRGIAKMLTEISKQYGIPHISRVHPAQEESANRRLKKELREIGVPWPEDQNLWDFLNDLNERTDLTPEGRETAQILALMTRRRAEYATSDEEGHEGLALEAGQYDHPSTPIRRFADMYNRALLEAHIAGQDPREVYEAVNADLRMMGFASLDEYMMHLNGREAASKAMDREMDNFMSLYMLAKPEFQGKNFGAYVKVARGGRFPMAVLQFRDHPISIVITGDQASGMHVLDEVRIDVNGADPATGKADIDFQKLGPLPAFKGQQRKARSQTGQRPRQPRQGNHGKKNKRRRRR
jgi:exoribonuclease R